MAVRHWVPIGGRAPIYRRIARRIRHRLASGQSVGRGLVAALWAVAPTDVHRQLARDLAEALAASCPYRASRIASTARRSADDRAEKLVSRRYGFVWLGNPKVASTSLIAALLQVDPEAALIKHATVDELYVTHPEARGYYSFAFLRNPFERTLSFYRDKYLRGGDFNVRTFIDPYWGVTPDSSFDELCDWLCTAYGSDAFADRHWLSQHRHVELPRGRWPDFLGRFESLERDLAVVARHLGVGRIDLPHLNSSTGLGASRASDRCEPYLTRRNRSLLRQRYAADLELGGYVR